MIPKDFITEWRKYAPWVEDFQVEQDLLISRSLIELFSNSSIAKSLAFRGGTALYKVYFNSAPRYSEDIDLVQIDAAPIGPIIDEIRKILDPLLGTPKRKFGPGVVSMTYRFDSEDNPSKRLKLKV